MSEMKTIEKLNWQKIVGLIPVIIQDYISGEVLMLGYMNNDALKQTKKTKYITFYSRTRKCLWIKGNISGNKLKLVKIYSDCDQDALLILVNPEGPTCHLNLNSCFYPAKSNASFLYVLEKIINNRKTNGHKYNNTYTTSLFNKGIKHIAQKVGEEGIEVALASVIDNKNMIYESADLMYHLLVLLQAMNLNLSKVIDELKNRNKNINHYT
ncbi:MAG: bifunctional phosphoribosyl-AMP cyclohydrolase/phosphoribosyl-ATP diphosphatase HisIE [Enterobacterales bacterium]